MLRGADAGRGFESARRGAGSDIFEGGRQRLPRSRPGTSALLIRELPPRLQTRKEPLGARGLVGVVVLRGRGGVPWLMRGAARLVSHL